MKFSSVVGHSEVKQRLVRSANEGRISHTLLFLGSEGSGSLPMAIAFAQFLVCEQRTADDSCGKCAGCIKMEKLVHPDVSYSYPVAPKEKISKPRSVDFISQWRSEVISNPYMNYFEWMEGLSLDNKQGNISVDESADILSRTSLKSVEAPYKIVIIWLVEHMNPSSANKLLKIIEEPPDNTLFFLISENQELLLSTVLSRTQLVKVNRISDSEMHEALAVKHGIDGANARRIVHRANGNYNEALKQIGNDEGDAELNRRFLEWMRSCLRLNVKNINLLSQEFGKQSRENQKNFLLHALSITRECMLINYGDRVLVRLEGKDLEDIQRFAPFVNSNNIFQFADELNRAHFHLERNANSKLLFTDLSFTMHHLLQVSKA